MDEVRINLKEEFGRKRREAIIDVRNNFKETESFIKNDVIPALRELRKWHSTASLFCITFYVIENVNSCHVVYNTNTSVGFTAGAPTYQVSKETLQGALSIASLYGIEAIQFIEDTHDAFRFKVLI